jgi:hypothetical protein
MEGDPIWLWLVIAWSCGGDLWGLRLFWQGITLWFLLGLFTLVNLLIPAAIMVRCLTKALIDRNASD